MIGKIIYKHRVKKATKGLKHIGNGSLLHIDPSIEFNHPENIWIGDFVMIRSNCEFYGLGGITIGDGTIISHEVEILSANHNYNSDDLEFLPFDDKWVFRPVFIGKCVWIGARSLILPGVTIGDGAVVGAGSVVTSDVPSCAVVGGNPARILKYRNKERFEQLLKSGSAMLVKERR